MFGKGVYFADIASKSVQYTNYGASNNFGLMLLCKVAIGKPNCHYSSDSSITLAKLPKGTNSTKGVGRHMPDPSGDIAYEKCTLATGKVVESKDPKAGLFYNEFIVYDVEQVEMKYLFKIKV